MDPQATIYDLLDAISRNDREATDELLMALVVWNRKGGFLPVVREHSQIDDAFVVHRKPGVRKGRVTA